MRETGEWRFRLAVPGVLALAGLVTLLALPTATAGPDGRKLFVETHKCSRCHAVPAAGIEAKTTSEKLKGPELGGKIQADTAAVAAYLRQEKPLKGGKHKVGFKGTDEELQAIVDWLGSLEAK